MIIIVRSKTISGLFSFVRQLEWKLALLWRSKKFHAAIATRQVITSHAASVNSQMFPKPFMEPIFVYSACELTLPFFFSHNIIKSLDIVMPYIVFVIRLSCHDSLSNNPQRATVAFFRRITTLDRKAILKPLVKYMPRCNCFRHVDIRRPGQKPHITAWILHLVRLSSSLHPCSANFNSHADSEILNPAIRLSGTGTAHTA